MKYLSGAWGIDVEAMQFNGDAASVNAFDAWLQDLPESRQDYGDCDFFVVEMNCGDEFDIYPGWYYIKGRDDLSFVAQAEFERLFAEPRR